ncbi:MAG: YdeI/OmpD-associated family protein [Terriglobales bacterium]
MPKPFAKTFRATLVRDGTRLKWVVVHLPLNVPKIWGSRGMLKVRGEINGFAFRTSLFPTGKGDHYLLINKRMQAGANAKVGSVATFRLEPDLEERIAPAPPGLKKILSGDRSLRLWYDKLNYSTRKYIADWITDVKSPEARERRTEQIAEQLMSVMEAEQELPPVLRVAFARDPAAYDGWQLMTPAKRRGHLFGIFYYRDPEAQGRRIGKMLEDAAELAGRKRG